MTVVQQLVQGKGNTMTDPFVVMRPIHFADGSTITTNINGTRNDVYVYYVGKYFNLGVPGRPAEDRLVKAISVEFLS